MGRLQVWVGACLFLTSVTVNAAPPADSPSTPPEPRVLKVEAGKSRLDAVQLFPKSMAEAREVMSKTRDYAGFLVRQEQVAGVLQAEQTAEVRVRQSPKCINVRVVKPDNLRGEETSYMPERVSHTVRFKPAGVEGVRGFQTLPVDSPKVLAHTRHAMTGVGLEAVLERVETILAMEKALGHPVAMTASEYRFADKIVMKYDLYMDVAHPKRYAPRVAIYFDIESKLPVRFEAYDRQSQLIEVQSYVGVTRNVGLGDANFAR